MGAPQLGQKADSRVRSSEEAASRAIPRARAAWNDVKLRDILNLPTDTKIVGLIPFGIPDENPPLPPKQSLNEIVHFDKW